MDAGKLGIGMIHQHFKLVDVFSAMDNVAMGMEGKRVKPKELKERLLKLTEKYGLEVEPECRYSDSGRTYCRADSPGDEKAVCHSAEDAGTGKRYYHYYPQAERGYGN